MTITRPGGYDGENTKKHRAKSARCFLLIIID